MQKVKKMENHNSGGKDKAKPTVVPLTESRIQTRRSISEHMTQEKEEETWY